MATREENLKKINDELEKLSDDELEQVAGGNDGWTAVDSTILYAYGLVDDYHGYFHTGLHWKSDSAAVDSGWAKAGITSVTKPWGDNQYFMGGEEITRDQAITHLKANFKQIREVPEVPF